VKCVVQTEGSSPLGFVFAFHDPDIDDSVANILQSSMERFAVKPAAERNEPYSRLYSSSSSSSSSSESSSLATTAASCEVSVFSKVFITSCNSSSVILPATKSMSLIHSETKASMFPVGTTGCFARTPCRSVKSWSSSTLSTFCFFPYVNFV